MKKSILLGLAGMMFVSTAAHAISVTGQAGEHYTNLGVGFGTESSGLAVTGNWMHSDNDGDAAGLGLGLNIPLGPFLATVGGKGMLHRWVAACSGKLATASVCSANTIIPRILSPAAFRAIRKLTPVRAGRLCVL